MYHVVIADDHPVVCRGLRRYFGSLGDVQVVAEVGSSANLPDVVSEHPCDVVVFDVWQTAGVSPILALKARHPHVAVVVLTMHDEQAYVHRAMAAGALGYVSKAQPLAELRTAIQQAARGLTYLSPPCDRVALGPTPARRLSRREEEVWTLLGEGATLSEIAQRLRLSIRTVATYEQALKTKLNLPRVHHVKYVAIRERAALQQRATSVSLTMAERGDPRPWLASPLSVPHDVTQ